MDRLKNKIAVITGSAKGIGRETARLFAREGARIVVTDIDEPGGHDTVAEIVAAGGQAMFLAHDVRSEAEWKVVIGKICDLWGRPSVLVNNAGIGVSGNVEDTEWESWRAVMSVNLDAVFLGIRQAVRAMKMDGGSIVNLSSIEGLIGDANLAAYNASKGAVRLLTKSAALYCASAGYNIRVNSIHPGFIRTPMVEAALQRSDNPQAAEASIAAKHPLGRIGEPIDIAYGALYLASDESKFMTGSELVIDGGYTAQ